MDVFAEGRNAHRVAVIVPAFNEENHIAAVVSSIPAWVARIYVVDDGSSDGTAGEVESCRSDRVQLIRHDGNRGVGAAMKTGFRAALEGSWDAIAKVDGDGQMVPEELGRLCDPIDQDLADYCKGNRFYFERATTGMPIHRGLGNVMLSFMTKMASGYWHVFDSQCGFLVVRTSFLRLLNLDALSDDYFFENDMLIKLNALGARVVDVPTSTLYGAEISDVRLSRVLLTFPPRLIGSGLGRFWRKYLVTDFSAIGALSMTGLPLLAFGVAFGSYHWWLSAVTGRLASTGTVMVAVLPVVLGVQLLLQAFSLSVADSPGAAETTTYIRTLVESDRLTPGSGGSSDLGRIPGD